MQRVATTKCQWWQNSARVWPKITKYRKTRISNGTAKTKLAKLALRIICENLYWSDILVFSSSNGDDVVDFSTWRSNVRQLLVTDVAINRFRISD